MAVQPTVFPDGWETLGIIQDHVLLLLLCSKKGTQMLSPFWLKRPIKNKVIIVRILWQWPSGRCVCHYCLFNCESCRVCPFGLSRPLWILAVIPPSNSQWWHQQPWNANWTGRTVQSPSLINHCTTSGMTVCWGCRYPGHTGCWRNFDSAAGVSCGKKPSADLDSRSD